MNEPPDHDRAVDDPFTFCDSLDAGLAAGFGRRAEGPFFTMKLVKGQTLAALLSDRGQPTEDRPQLLGIALQVCQALVYAHAKGVIHRDLKPANVMLGAFGEVQVINWGLAKVLHTGGVVDEEMASRQHQDDGTLVRTARSSGSGGGHGTDTEAGSLLGTPAYMPPEQANGEIGNSTVAPTSSASAPSCARS